MLRGSRGACVMAMPCRAVSCCWLPVLRAAGGPCGRRRGASSEVNAAMPAASPSMSAVLVLRCRGWPAAMVLDPRPGPSARRAAGPVPAVRSRQAGQSGRRYPPARLGGRRQRRRRWAGPGRAWAVPRTPHQGMPSHVPHESGRPGSRHLHAGRRLASRRASARLILGQFQTRGFDAI